MNIAVNPPAKEESVSLQCTHGSSNKEYHAQLKHVENGLWQIETKNGRIGGTLIHRAKFTAPVSYDAAKREFDSLIKSKLKDKYVIFGCDAPEFSKVSEEKKFLTTHVPQLLKSIDEDELDYYLRNPYWGAQEKMDGERRQLSNTLGDHIGTNKKAEVVSVPSAFIDAAKDIFGNIGVYHIDGESMNVSLYWAFDALFLEKDIKEFGFEERYEALSKLILSSGSSTIKVVPLAKTEVEKRDLLDSIKNKNGEGIVFKRLNGSYSEDSIKFKLYAEATVVVMCINQKRSVAIGAVGVDGEIVGVGNVSIPPNAEIPAVGSYIDVTYLYYFSGGSLFQPFLSKPRPDKDEADKIKSLKHKEVVI